jgi:hypothetical protein
VRISRILQQSVGHLRAIRRNVDELGFVPHGNPATSATKPDNASIITQNVQSGCSYRPSVQLQKQRIVSSEKYFWSLFVVAGSATCSP